MRDDVMVNAADIARIADVGRAAVSNWRKRFDDFPKPVGGTATSPAFSLAEVEQWLRRHDRYVEVSPLERASQRLPRAGDDLRPGDIVGRAGALLIYLKRDASGRPALSKLPDEELAARLPETIAKAVPELPGDPSGAVPADASLIRALADLAEDTGPEEVFDGICERYVEAHSRR